MANKPNYSELPDPIAELVKINPVPSILIDMKTLSVAVINEAALKLLGYSEHEMIGEPITKFVPLDDIVAVQKSADEPPPEGETQWRCVTKEAKSSSLNSNTGKPCIGDGQRVSRSLSKAAQFSCTSGHLMVLPPVCLTKNVRAAPDGLELFLSSG